jgi:hypothetical protein
VVVVVLDQDPLSLKKGDIRRVIQPEKRELIQLHKIRANSLHKIPVFLCLYPPSAHKT